MEDHEKFLGDWNALLDQVLATARETGKIAYALYTGACEAGFKHDDAMNLTRDYMLWFLKNGEHDA